MELTSISLRNLDLNLWEIHTYSGISRGEWMSFLDNRPCRSRGVTEIGIFSKWSWGEILKFTIPYNLYFNSRFFLWLWITESARFVGWESVHVTCASFKDFKFKFTLNAIPYTTWKGSKSIQNSTNNFQWGWLRPHWPSQTFALMYRSVSACFSIRPIF